MVDAVATSARFNVICEQIENADSSLVWERASASALDRAVNDAHRRRRCTSSRRCERLARVSGAPGAGQREEVPMEGRARISRRMRRVALAAVLVAVGGGAVA